MASRDLPAEAGGQRVDFATGWPPPGDSDSGLLRPIMIAAGLALPVRVSGLNVWNLESLLYST